MSQRDILRLLDTSNEWWDCKRLSKYLSINRKSVSRNIRSLFKYKDFFGLEFKPMNRRCMYVFRKVKK